MLLPSDMFRTAALFIALLTPGSLVCACADLDTAPPAPSCVDCPATPNPGGVAGSPPGGAGGSTVGAAPEPNGGQAPIPESPTGGSSTTPVTPGGSGTGGGTGTGATADAGAVTFTVQ